MKFSGGVTFALASFSALHTALGRVSNTNDEQPSTTTHDAVSAAISTANSTSKYESWVEQSVDVMMKNFYNTTTGLWQGTWWDSAVAYTVMADIESLLADNGMVFKYNMTEMWDNIYKVHVTNAKTSGYPNFIGPFFDDQGWWTINFIAAYDITGDKKYLQLAADLVWDVKTTGSRPAGSCKPGGVFWKRPQTACAVISNLLYMSTTAHLANRVPENATMYTQWSIDEWQWLQDTGLYNATSAILYGGIDCQTCEVQTHISSWTYQQGVLIGGLLELDKAIQANDTISQGKNYTGTDYVALAQKVATATITDPLFLRNGTILHEPVGGYTSDTAEFKGIFMRNLMILNRDHPDDSYVKFAEANAQSIWNNARLANGTILPQWEGAGNSDVSSWTDKESVAMSSAISALLAAWEMTDGSKDCGADIKGDD